MYFHEHPLKGNYLSIFAKINLRHCKLPVVSYPEFSPWHTKPFLFYQFLPNFPKKIVGVDLLHHVWAEKCDRTRLGDVGPVRGLGCHIKILWNSPKMAELSSGIIACFWESIMSQRCDLHWNMWNKRICRMSHTHTKTNTLAMNAFWFYSRHRPSIWPLEPLITGTPYNEHNIKLFRKVSSV